jgi:hypothetical protein
VVDPRAPMTWCIEAPRLARTEAGILQEAVEVVTYWLDAWADLLGAVTAATTTGLAVTVTVTPRMTGTVGGTVRVDSDVPRVVITVPGALVTSGAAALRFELLRCALGALHRAGDVWPHDPPTQVWHPGEDAPDLEGTNPRAVALELLGPEEMILLGPPEDPEDEFDDYVLDRVEESGAAVVVDTDSGLQRTLELTE